MKNFSLIVVQSFSDLGDAFFLFAYDESGKVSASEVGACIR